MNFRQWTQEIEALRSDPPVSDSIYVDGNSIRIQVNEHVAPSIYIGNQRTLTRQLRTVFIKNKSIFITLYNSLRGHVSDVQDGMTAITNKLVEPHVGPLVMERLKGGSVDEFAVILDNYGVELKPYLEKLVSRNISAFTADIDDNILLVRSERWVTLHAFGCQFNLRVDRAELTVTKANIIKDNLLFMGNYEFIKSRVVRFVKAFELLGETIEWRIKELPTK